ncbi:MAG TPA: DUF131 domain-containing protein [Nanoarchaeota archaeon]|nr:DUF131 domain-containing protein [Nanoarchaeota archaeon]
MEEFFIKFGIALILIGFIILLIGAFLNVKSENVKFGFGGFIGPIPFGFANDPKLLVLIIAISIIILVFFLLSIKQI